MFISAAGVLISFDTSYVFVVVGREGASPALWEVHPKRGKARKARSFSPAQAAALAGRRNSPRSARERQKRCRVYQIIAGYSSSKGSLRHVTATPRSVMIYEHLAAPLPDVPALCFLQELEAVHPEAVPRRGSVQKRQALGKGNQAFWKWQSPWALLRCLSRLY